MQNASSLLHRILPLGSRSAPSAASASSWITRGSRCISSTTSGAPSMDTGELAIAGKLQQGLKTHTVAVRDTSGGCGEFYTVEVVAEDFRGLSTVKQHQLVHKLLAEELKSWHGMNLSTKAP